MALVFAVAAAALLGASDFWAARASKHIPSITVTRSAVTVSLVLSPLLWLVVDSRWITRDVLIGAGSGLAMIGGLLLLYRGYSVARMGIVAPMSSVLLAAVPVAYDLARGQQPSTLTAVGIVLALVALVLTSLTPGGHGSVRLGAQLGLGSGILFGIAFILMGEVSKASGLVPVTAQRLAGAALLYAIVPMQRMPLLAPHGPIRRATVVAGTFGVLAIGSLQLAFQRGASGPVSVAASQFATVAVILSVLFNRERMRWWQAAGVAGSAVGVALMAAGS